jgi:uncharacterized protein DUF6159
MNGSLVGFELFRTSWAVLRKQPQLLAFPALSLVASLFLLGLVGLPFVVHPAWLDQVERGGDARILAYLGLFLFYFAANFVVVFFQVGLVACVSAHFEGRRPAVTDGLAAAAARLPQILGWSAFAATVGLILKVAQDRLPLAGRIVTRIAGIAFAVATSLVVPVLAFERLGPIAALRRSAGLVKRSWGEGMVGAATLGLLSFFLVLPGVLMIVIGGANDRPIAGVALAMVWFVAISVITGALRQIFIAAAYEWAAHGRVLADFPEGLMPAVFVARRR